MGVVALSVFGWVIPGFEPFGRILRRKPYGNYLLFVGDVGVLAAGDDAMAVVVGHWLGVHAEEVPGSGADLGCECELVFPAFADFPPGAAPVPAG